MAIYPDTTAFEHPLVSLYGVNELSSIKDKIADAIYSIEGALAISTNSEDGNIVNLKNQIITIRNSLITLHSSLMHRF